MKTPETLVVFARNPVLGQVKTRLAGSVGERRALEIYLNLLGHTARIVEESNRPCHIYYSDHIPEDESPFPVSTSQKLQTGRDLGERMRTALQEELRSSAKVVLIGTDCGELDADIISQSFSLLNRADLVLGPASDGGYYLIGMKGEYVEVFESIRWSTSTVLAETLRMILDTKADVALLPTLNDVDTIEDWQKLGW